MNCCRMEQDHPGSMLHALGEENGRKRVKGILAVTKCLGDGFAKDVMSSTPDVASLPYNFSDAKGDWKLDGVVAGTDGGGSTTFLPTDS